MSLAYLSGDGSGGGAALSHQPVVSMATFIRVTGGGVRGWLEATVVFTSSCAVSFVSFKNVASQEMSCLAPPVPRSFHRTCQLLGTENAPFSEVVWPTLDLRKQNKTKQKERNDPALRMLMLLVVSLRRGLSSNLWRLELE